MMDAQVAIIIACTLSLISAGGSARQGSNCGNCIIVNTKAGKNIPSCLKSTPLTPCKNLSYVLQAIHNMSLNNRQVILQGDHYINQTLTVTNVDGLSITGSEFKGSTIHCMPPHSFNDTGSGLVFLSLSNLTLLNVIFEGCGTLQNSTTLRNGSNIKYRSAVYILNCTNVNYTKSSFHRSMGRGLSLHDVNGYVIFNQTVFSENMVPKEEQHRLFGGGGLYIEFTYCTPGYPNCNFTENLYNNNSRYLIKDCVFRGNRATSTEVAAQIHTIQFRLLAGKDGNNFGQGGGIAITFKGTSLRNSIEISNCSFYNNSAQYGGGLEAIFQDYAVENVIHICTCRFTNNSALERGGGALKLGYFVKDRNVVGNNITVQDTSFINNSAGWGGGVGFFSSRFKLELRNTMIFFNCTWIRNSASIGSAMRLGYSAWNSVLDGEVPATLLYKCTFINNYVTNMAVILRSANDGVSKHVVQSGTLHVDSFEIKLSKNITFIGSRGSAIVATSSSINVLEDTVLRFVNNSATNGGAMALLGYSVLELHSHSQVIFESNYASERGGAVYATSPHQPEFIFSHRCFISHHSGIDPSKWNSSLTFSNNEARYGDAIFTDSLLQCAKHIGNVVTDVKTALRWEPFKYIPGIEEYTIATSPASINFTLPVEITPGERINLHLISLDDLDQNIPTAYQVILDIHVGRATTSTSYISDDGYLQLSGTPGTEFTITLQTQNTRHISFSRDSKLGHCPLGLTLKNEVCVCSASTSDKRLVGITECNMSNFRAFLQIGYWVGCTRDGEIATSYCPLGYCNYQSASDTQRIDVCKSCDDMNVQRLCTSQRKGQLCGECEEGSAVFYHSENFKCDHCLYGAFGLLFYVISELVPLILLFAVIMIMKLKLTSGLMQSILLFAQTITFINRIPHSVVMSQANQLLLRIHTFLIGFLSLDFFRLDELSFCLWNGATVLHNLAFRYLTTLVTILLLTGFILSIKHSMLKTKVLRTVCSEKLMKWAGKNKLFKNAIVHGISTFLILSYTQYTVTSFQILARLPLYGEGEQIIGSVVSLEGSMQYFGAGHLPYAISAVFVLLLLSLPPPLLLISYPLLWKVKGKFISHRNTENETTIWPIRKLLPLIDSFQGTFRNNQRMFAGLLFLWRVILAGIFAFTSNLHEFFLLTEVALLCFFTIHAVARPYKRRLFNIIDILVLANLSIINALTWYIFNTSSFGGERQSIEAVISIKILLMYLPLLTLVIIIIFWFIRKCSVIQKWKHFVSSAADEEDFSTNDTSILNRSADDDLFSRAMELNTSPLTVHVSSSEVGITLQTDETDCEYRHI